MREDKVNIVGEKKPKNLEKAEKEDVVSMVNLAGCIKSVTITVA